MAGYIVRKVQGWRTLLEDEIAEARANVFNDSRLFRSFSPDLRKLKLLRQRRLRLEWTKEQREKYAEAKRVSEAKKPEHYKKKRDEWKANNPEKMSQYKKEWKERNQEAVKADRRTQYLKNKAVEDARSIAWQNENRDLVNQRKRERYQQNKEAINAALRKARKKKKRNK